MRLHFYAALLLGITCTNAVTLQNETGDDYVNDLEDYAQVDLEGTSGNKGEGEAEADAGNIIKVNIPECQ